MFPSLAPDGTLYYASDGFIGMGGLDIFKSKGQKENWTQPENLKYPMNSGGDDFAFVINKEQENQISGFLLRIEVEGPAMMIFMPLIIPSQK